MCWWLILGQEIIFVEGKTGDQLVGSSVTSQFILNRELARCLATTNVIESPNSVVRRVSGRVTNYRDVAMVMRWTAAVFLEAEKAFRGLRGHQHIAALFSAMRPTILQNQKVA